MRFFLIKLGVGALALWLTSLLVSGVYFERGANLGDVLLAALVLGLVNALIRPLLLLLTLPITLLTLGLFALVVNAVVLWLVAALTRLDLSGFGGAFWGALVLAMVSWLLDATLERALVRRR